MVGAPLRTVGRGASPATVRIGVLGLQGDYDAHRKMLERIDGVEPSIVKMPAEIELCDGLIIPGGESTTVGKLMERYGIDIAIRRRASEGMAVFGTCTGMILMAKHIDGRPQKCLELMDMTVRRNAFGRQVDSFEVDLSIPEVGTEPLQAVFIRAPLVTRMGDSMRALATLKTGEIVLVRDGNLLACAFHPELTDDCRMHEYFAKMAGRE